MTLLLVANLAAIFLRPTFNSCSVSAGEEKRLDPSVEVEYRENGGEWIRPEDFHGDLLGLKEGTAYNVRLIKDGRIVEKASFSTWSSDVPIARTIELDPDKFKAPYIIDLTGSEKGWIRVTVKGSYLFNDSDKPTFIVEGASHILLDDMILRGAADSRNVICIRNSEAVRVRNCDIAGWGASSYKPDYTMLPPEQRYSGKGNGRYYDSNGKGINWNSAILIGKGASKTVIERCYIHDPLSRSVSWYYTHPAGPEAIEMGYADHSTVIRWCDFVAADGHNWNDAVEGQGNFKTNGGFNRDADIYGNFMIFSSDDCIELDGGQRHVRCFDNRFESSYCGVSVQGQMVGPSYVLNNLFSGMGESSGLYGQTIKTSNSIKPDTWPDAHTYLLNNILWGEGIGIEMRKSINLTVAGNKFCSSQKLKTKTVSEASVIGENEFKVRMEEKDLPVSYPVRNLPFFLSRSRVSVGLSREDLVIDISGTVPEGTRVVVPEAMPWISGYIDGDKLIVRFDDSKMQTRRHYRAALLVRTPDGLSRPLSIYATTQFVPPLHAEQSGDIAIYAEDFHLTGDGEATAEFKVSKEGRYWCMLYGKSASGINKPKAKLDVTMDGEHLGLSTMQTYEYPCWTMLCPGMRPIHLMVYHFDLKPGLHTFTIKGDSTKEYEYNSIVLTDNPESFDPNRIPLQQ